MISYLLPILLQIIFWASLVGILHSYGTYPILLNLLSKGKKLSNDRFQNIAEEWPHVVVLMAAYNEDAVLEKTLTSILGNDYPIGKFDVLIGSDNSTDRSHEIVRTLQNEHSNLKLKVFEGRSGKIRIINQLVEECRERFGPNGEPPIFILCDANITWSKDLTKKLVSHFKREDVGLVGATVIDAGEGHAGIAGAEDCYVNRENQMKFQEGVLWGATIGAFGACYAMRSELFEAVPTHYNVDDFYLTMHCLEEGKQAIVDPEAICYEAVSEHISEEFRRKKRIAIGNFQNLNHFKKFLLPWNCGLPTCFAFWSHKGLRWLGPVLLIFAFATSIALSMTHLIYLFAAIGLCFSFLIAAIDGLMVKLLPCFHVKVFRFARYFYMMNLALLMGCIRFCLGVKNSVWEPTRRVIEGNETSTVASPAK